MNMAEGGFYVNDLLPSADDSHLAVNPRENMVPLTVKQILGISAEPGQEFLIDNQVRKQLTLVGRIVSSEVTRVSVIYEIEDGTGMLRAEDFVLQESSVPLENNTYVYIAGKLSMRDPHKVEIFKIKPITDFNQVCYHAMQALFVHLFATRGLPANSAYAHAEKGADARPSGFHQRDDQANAQEKLETEIVEYIRNHGDAGATKREIISAFANDRWSIADIETIIERLELTPKIYEIAEGAYQAL